MLCLLAGFQVRMSHFHRWPCGQAHAMYKSGSAEQFVRDDGGTVGCLCSSASFVAGLCSPCTLVCWLVDSSGLEFLCVRLVIYGAGGHVIVTGPLTTVEAQWMLWHIAVLVCVCSMQTSGSSLHSSGACARR